MERSGREKTQWNIKAEKEDIRLRGFWRKREQTQMSRLSRIKGQGGSVDCRDSRGRENRLRGIQKRENNFNGIKKQRGHTQRNLEAKT